MAQKTRKSLLEILTGSPEIEEEETLLGEHQIHRGLEGRQARQADHIKDRHIQRDKVVQPRRQQEVSTGPLSLSARQREEISDVVEDYSQPEAQEEDEHWTDQAQEGQLTVDVYQKEGSIIIKSAIAGVGPDDVEVNINNDIVTIRGKRQPPDDVKNADYYHQELYWGNFSRTVILPVEIDIERANASMKNGILTINLPKRQESKHRKLKINIA